MSTFEEKEQAMLEAMRSANKTNKELHAKLKDALDAKDLEKRNYGKHLEKLRMELDRLKEEIRAWQDIFDEEWELAQHQSRRYVTSAHDAKIMFEQRKKLRDGL